MPKSLPAQHTLRMTLLPADPVIESRCGARSSAAIRTRLAEAATTRPGTGRDAAERRSASPAVPARPAAPDARGADRYANAGPDCYWPEAG